MRRLGAFRDETHGLHRRKMRDNVSRTKIADLYFQTVYILIPVSLRFKYQRRKAISVRDEDLSAEIVSVFQESRCKSRDCMEPIWEGRREMWSM
jgi:hypothetical protein